MDRKILAIPGPTILDLDVLRAMLVSDVGHMSVEFTGIFSETLRLLRRLLYVDDDYQPIILAGSGTVGMEASLTNFVSKNDKVLVVSNGYFGDLAEKILSRYPVNINKLSSREPGDRVDNETILSRLEEDKYSALIVTHVDTSTGVKHDISELGKYTKDQDTLLIVDGVCSVGGEKINMKEAGIDVLFTGSQKALSTPVGLSIIWLSPKAMDRLKMNNLSPHYMDLGEWLKIMRSYEEGAPKYYATPAVNLIYALNGALRKIFEYGLDKWFNKHVLMAGSFRAGLQEVGLELMAKDYCRANTVSAIYLPENIESKRFRDELYRMGIVVAGGILKGLRDKYFRVGHMGMMNLNDIVAILAAMERVLYSLGYDIELGSSLRGFQEYLTEHI